MDKLLKWWRSLFRQQSADPIEQMWETIVDLECRSKAKNAYYMQLKLSLRGVDFMYETKLASAAEEAVYLETQLAHYKKRYADMLAAREEEKEFYRKMGLLDP